MYYCIVRRDYLKRSNKGGWFKEVSDFKYLTSNIQSCLISDLDELNIRKRTRLYKPVLNFETPQNSVDVYQILVKLIPFLSYSQKIEMLLFDNKYLQYKDLKPKFINNKLKCQYSRFNNPTSDTIINKFTDLKAEQFFYKFIDVLFYKN